ncbi:restriction endonuclease subunit S [Bathymodiolus platifrons methanotrophic gill symbiont]|uniref:restriction endonuclease subunit S n=1 Tax=Bathymodiolus platifrons methanotrophic gill symbiont TaxID=113268 RepID=UPI002452BD13|nr:restriction endonuclease subunit S [Bathymodiolus platifrons methanotrophic gill symbiont]
MKHVEWGEFRLGELFEFEAIKQAKSQKAIPTDNTENGVPYIVQSMSNNMFSRNVNKQWLIEHNEFPVSGNRIVLGVTLPAVSYQPVEFGASQVITAKSEWLNNKNGVFISSSISKLMYQFSYQKKPGMKIYKNMSVLLPAKNGGADFEFMENFIAELETERIAELEAYLSAAGLKNTSLTLQEQQALDDFKDLNFEEFNVINIFNVKNSGNILSRDIIENRGETPYLCSSNKNNAVSSYISYDEEYLDKGNCVFIGGKTFVVSYQEKDFYSNDSHNLILYLKNEEKRNKFNQLFLATCINKSLDHKYSWGDSISNRKIQKDEISLPTQNNQPDYSSMETFISAIQKLVIKDVVHYADNKIGFCRKKQMFV